MYLCNEDSKCFCFECKLYFCDNCYKFIHEKKKNIQHKKETLDPFISIDFKCSDHPENALNLFCIEEKGKFKIY